MAEDDRFERALDLLRRLEPKHVTTHLNSIISLVPSLTEELLASVDQPLAVARCKKTGRDYLLCDYNRDGDSYRSPWSGEFENSLGGTGQGGIDDDGNNQGAGEGAVPSERVRKMEIKANEAFDVYRELYYEGGVSSVYFWNLDDGFAGVVLLKRGSEILGDMDLSGNMTRHIETDLQVENDSSHIVNIGKLVEDMELNMRNLLQEVYFGKAKDVVCDLRSVISLAETNKDRAYHQEMMRSLKQSD